MNRKRRWTLKQLEDAVASSRSMGQVILKLGLVPAGGNYDQLRKYIQENSFDISHFTGRGWSKGMRFPFKPLVPLSEILVRSSRYQSYKLKARLFSEKLKIRECEMSVKDVASAGLGIVSNDFVFFFSSRRRHTRYIGDWSSDVCSYDLRRLFGLEFPKNPVFLLDESADRKSVV